MSAKNAPPWDVERDWKEAFNSMNFERTQKLFDVMDRMKQMVNEKEIQKHLTNNIKYIHTFHFLIIKVCVEFAIESNWINFLQFLVSFYKQPFPIDLIFDLAILSKNQPLLSLHFLIDCGAEISKESIIMAVRNENIETLKLLVKTNPKILQNQKNLENTFWVAFRNETLEILKFLFEIGSMDVNKRSTTIRGLTPLTIVASKGNLKMMKLLIEEKGADLEGVDNFGQTPLWVATQCKNFEMIQYLVEKNANLDVYDVNERRSPLLIAISQFEWKTVKFFVEKGARVDLMNDGENAVLRIAKLRNWDMLKFIIENAKIAPDLNKQNAHGETPLVLVCKLDSTFASKTTLELSEIETEDFEMVKYLVEKHRVEVHQSELLETVMTKKFETAKYLIEKDPRGLLVGNDSLLKLIEKVENLEFKNYLKQKILELK